MKVISLAVKNNEFDPKYGKYGSQFNENGVPNLSFPFTIIDAPENTKSFAVVFEDKDAVEVCGFTWIHWLACNIKETDIKENASLSADFVQGVNSWVSMQGGNQSKELSMFFGGMAPPDKPHLYELHVYALDTELNLDNGFYYNHLHQAMKNHIIDQATLAAYYNN